MKVDKKKLQKIIRKTYKHFDLNLTYKSSEKFLNKVVYRRDKVAHYRFRPFINFNYEKKIYDPKNKKIKEKDRLIALTAHHDALIYSYYSQILSNYYEEYIKRLGISLVPTAYRKKLHKSNIDASKEIFDYICSCEKCWIIKGDFKGFFDNIRHKILCNNICEVLGVNKLDPDWNSVFKSLTKYRYVSKENVVKSMKKAGIKSKKNCFTRSRAEIGKLIRLGKLKINGPNQIGIPQGTALSAVLANVYMIKFDKIVNDLISQFNGKYRRYSDDFVIVIPCQKLNTLNEVEKIFNNIKKKSNELTKLTIENTKTKIFKYNQQSDNNIIRYVDSNQNFVSWFDYLGFKFNGKIVMMREKSVYKFHYKSKNALNLIGREEKDRNRVKNGDMVVNFKWGWINGEQGYKRNPLYRREKSISRMKNHKKTWLNYTPHKKVVTQFYLITDRYGDKYSMIGYAKRAQHVFDDKKQKYKSIIWKQIRDQVSNNRIYISGIRRKN